MNDIQSLESELLGAVEAATSADALEQVRVAALGRKGALTERLKTLGQLAPDARR